MSFLKAASRKTTSIERFLKESLEDGGVRYRTERGKRHYLYIPSMETETLDAEGNVESNNKGIVAISGKVHEWKSPDGSFRATVCLKDVVRNGENGESLNDGSCPFCDTIRESWDIYNYRFELESEKAKREKSGADLEKHIEALKGELASERKTKEPRNLIYLLVAMLELSPNNPKEFVIDKETGLPEFKLRVMKLTERRVKDIQTQLENSGLDMLESELIISYPDTNDSRLLVIQSTNSPVFDKITEKNKDLKEKINIAVSNFEWAGIEKSFPEWAGMTSREADKIVNDLFSQWRKYLTEAEQNENAKYLEYVGLKRDEDGSQDPYIPDVNAIFSGTVTNPVGQPVVNK